MSVSLGIKADKTKDTFISRHQNAGRSHNVYKNN